MLGQAVGPPVQLHEGPGAVARPDGGAVAESARGALEATVHRTSSHGENILLHREIVVNTHGVYASRMDDPVGRTTDDDVRREIVETVRRFVAREVIPVAADLERHDRFPADIVEGMRALGLFGVTIPEAYGGLGLDLLTYVGVIEELSYGWMSLTGIVNTHTMAATLIMEHGTEEQKSRWLPTMATGERRGALSLSEPDAGSDTRNISCRARKDGDHYVVTGTKAWVTNGERASIVALAARTEEGISALVVEKEPGPPSGDLGQQARRQARLPRRGDGGDGLCRPPGPGGEPGGRGGSRPPADPGHLGGGADQHRRTGGRGGPGRLRRGAHLRAAADHLRQAHRRAPGHPDEAGRHGHPPGGTRLLTRNAAERKTAGLRCDVEAGMAKLFASETAFELATEAMRIHGGVGYTTDLPVERYLRDAPLMMIGEGTNEIQRLVIARGLLARSRS